MTLPKMLDLLGKHPAIKGVRIPALSEGTEPYLELIVRKPSGLTRQPNMLNFSPNQKPINDGD